MLVQTGISEGEFFTGHTCPVCLFAGDQPDHSDLHLCPNWGYEPQEGYHRESRATDSEVFDYLRYCHENGETPTITHLTAIVRQIRIADGEWEEDAA
jgi:hypothetical protein